MSRVRQGKSIEIGGIKYRIGQTLGDSHRPRWRVKEDRPSDLNRNFTLLELPVTQATVQLVDALRKLQGNYSGLPRLRDHRKLNGNLYLLVTWFQGIDLQRYLERVREGRYSIGIYEAVRRTASLAKLIGILHRDCRVVHGDIKPSNLILPSDRSPIAIIDFGSSWQIEKTRGRELGDGCNEHYSAPELYDSGSGIDERCDQFSIAVILFEMLTGNLPYEGFGGLAGHNQYRREFEEGLESIRSCSEAVRDLPIALTRSLDLFFRKSLAFAPENRFPSTRAFTNELDSVFAAIKKLERKAQTAEQHRLSNSWIERLLGR